MFLLEGIPENAGGSASDEKGLSALLYRAVCQQNTPVPAISIYFLNAYQDGITPGQKITIQHNVSFNDWRAAPHLAPLVGLTAEEIKQRKEASTTLENELYAKLKQLASEWDEQAAQTMLLERALEYVHTPEVEHTDNEWKKRENGVWEISKDRKSTRLNSSH